MPTPPVPPNDNVPYPPDPAGRRVADGRPLPGRPATAQDHHDHRHFPFKLSDGPGGCPVCVAIEANKIPKVHPDPTKDIIQVINPIPQEKAPDPPSQPPSRPSR